MSALWEVFDRLTGVGLIRERVAETRDIVVQLRQIVIDHERRLLRIEARIDPPTRTVSRKRLPPGS